MLMPEYDELLAACAVAAEAQMERLERLSDRATTHAALAEIIDGVLKDYGIEFQDGSQQNLRASLQYDTFDEMPSVHMMRQMEPEELAMEAFGPLSKSSRIAALLLAEHREPAADTAQGGCDD